MNLRKHAANNKLVMALGSLKKPLLPVKVCAPPWKGDRIVLSDGLFGADGQSIILFDHNAIADDEEVAEWMADFIFFANFEVCFFFKSVYILKSPEQHC